MAIIEPCTDVQVFFIKGYFYRRLLSGKLLFQGFLLAEIACCNGLSSQEINLSVDRRMNLSTKEIDNLMDIYLLGLGIARFRLRKKFNLERSDILQEYILKY